MFLGETIINDYLSFVEVGFKYNLQSLKEELKRLQTEKCIKTPKHGAWSVCCSHGDCDANLRMQCLNLEQQ